MGEVPLHPSSRRLVLQRGIHILSTRCLSPVLYLSSRGLDSGRRLLNLTGVRFDSPLKKNQFPVRIMSKAGKVQTLLPVRIMSEAGKVHACETASPQDPTRTPSILYKGYSKFRTRTALRVVLCSWV